MIMTWGVKWGRNPPFRETPKMVTLEPLHVTSDFWGPTFGQRQAADVPTKAEALTARWDPSTPLVADKGASQLPLPTLGSWNMGLPPETKFKRRLVTPENDGFAPSRFISKLPQHFFSDSMLSFRGVKTHKCEEDCKWTQNLWINSFFSRKLAVHLRSKRLIKIN